MESFFHNHRLIDYIQLSYSASASDQYINNIYYLGSNDYEKEFVKENEILEFRADLSVLNREIDSQVEKLKKIYGIIIHHKKKKSSNIDKIIRDCEDAAEKVRKDVSEVIKKYNNEFAKAKDISEKIMFLYESIGMIQEKLANNSSK